MPNMDTVPAALKWGQTGANKSMSRIQNPRSQTAGPLRIQEIEKPIHVKKKNRHKPEFAHISKISRNSCRIPWAAKTS